MLNAVRASRRYYRLTSVANFPPFFMPGAFACVFFVSYLFVVAQVLFEKRFQELMKDRLKVLCASRKPKRRTSFSTVQHISSQTSRLGSSVLSVSKPMPKT
jgi:hypothetical protein